MYQNSFLYLVVQPTVESSPMDMLILEHDDVTLTCIYTGSPKPVISWHKDGNTVPDILQSGTQLFESRNDTTGIYTVRLHHYFFNCLYHLQLLNIVGREQIHFNWCVCNQCWEIQLFSQQFCIS